MSRISNSKKYNDMCNSYEARIMELESERDYLQQMLDETHDTLSMEYSRLCKEYDDLSLKYKNVLSQIETEGGGEKRWKEPEDRTLSILRDFIEEENGFWSGRASDLLDAISAKLQEEGEEYKTNSIVRKLNVSASRLREDYGIIYRNKRTNKGSKITLRREKEPSQIETEDGGEEQ